MNLKIILNEISNLEYEYKILKKELKNTKLIKSKKKIYIKEYKDEFLFLWKKYVLFFKKFCI